MPRSVLRSCLALGAALAIGQAQAQTETLQDILISGQSLVPVDTDDPPGPSAGDSGYQAFFVPGGNDGQDCIAVVGTGIFNDDSGEDYNYGYSTFNFQQTGSSPGFVALEEIGDCGSYYDGRDRPYTGQLTNGDAQVAKSSHGGYDTLLIQRPTSPGGVPESVGSGQLVDSNSDGVFDAVVGTASNGSNLELSLLMDLEFYPDADNPTHLVLPAVMDDGAGNRGFFDAYIPMNPDFTITAVNEETGDPIGGVGLRDGITVGRLPQGLNQPGMGPVAIPLLSRWGMAGLMLVLLGITVAGMRRLRS